MCQSFLTYVDHRIGLMTVDFRASNCLLWVCRQRLKPDEFTGRTVCQSFLFVTKVGQKSGFQEHFSTWCDKFFHPFKTYGGGKTGTKPVDTMHLKPHAQNRHRNVAVCTIHLKPHAQNRRPKVSPLQNIKMFF